MVSPRARKIINSTKPIRTRVPRGSTKKGSAGYDNIRDDIESFKHLREGTIEHIPTLAKHIVNKEYVDSEINGQLHSWDFTLLDPNGLYGIDTQIFVGWATADLTITKIQVELNADPLVEPTGDLKYADDFITLANPVVINDWDTTGGKRTDTSITSPSVASGKAIYIQFDSEPTSVIAQIHFHIEWEFD